MLTVSDVRDCLQLRHNVSMRDFRFSVATVSMSLVFSGAGTASTPPLWYSSPGSKGLFNLSLRIQASGRPSSWGWRGKGPWCLLRVACRRKHTPNDSHWWEDFGGQGRGRERSLGGQLDSLEAELGL